jgi:hypothetical protein
MLSHHFIKAANLISTSKVKSHFSNENSKRTPTNFIVTPNLTKLAVSSIPFIFRIFVKNKIEQSFSHKVQILRHIQSQFGPLFQLWRID